MQSCLYAVFSVVSQLVSKVGLHWVSIAVLKLFLKIVLHLVSSTVVQCLEKVGTGKCLYDIISNIITNSSPCLTTLTWSYSVWQLEWGWR